MPNTPKEETFKIPIEELFPGFEDHLQLENNSRILFSGKFGIGKTYYLNEFFNTEENKNKYEVFRLCPVNYQISSNQDIIEYLKYDILIELIKKDENILEGKDYLNLLDLQRLMYLYGKEKVEKITILGVSTGIELTALFTDSILPGLGRTVAETIKLSRDFWKFKNSIENKDKNDILKFINEIEKKKIEETDILSQLLRDKIKGLKGDKKSVLILDDMERIDPDHIFRILNVFSAHFDNENKELDNKFGFDKIIMVADYDNLKSIFHHKYGKETDSSGYFDKFYSFEIFQISNEEVIDKFIGKIIYESGIEEEKFSTTHLIKDVLSRSLHSGKLNLRQLLKGIYFPLKYLQQDGSSQQHLTIPKVLIVQNINSSIKILISVFSGLENELIDVLKSMKLDLTQQQQTDVDENLYKWLSLHLLNIINPSNIGASKHYFITDENSRYEIPVDSGRITTITNKSFNISSQFLDRFLLYDLLIKYIEEKYYKKDNLWIYNRIDK